MAVPTSRLREIAEMAMKMDGVLKLYFGESNIPTASYITLNKPPVRRWTMGTLCTRQTRD